MNSPVRKVKHGTVTTLRAKFENLGSISGKTEDVNEKVEVKRLTSSANKKHTTPASKRKMSRTKSAKKIVLIINNLRSTISSEV